MPPLNNVKQWYKDNGMPLLCKYCGSDEDLTKDHINAKSNIPQKIRWKLWKNRFKDPKTYYGQFALCCEKCNKMKGAMNHPEFIIHIRKIIKYLSTK